MTRIGNLEWAKSTQGNLNQAEKLKLLAPMFATTAHYVVGRLRLILGLRAKTPFSFDPSTIQLPDSKLAQLAEEACQETLSIPIMNHSYRTFFFAWALAHLDGIQPDLEHLYVSSLLHDIELENNQAQHCFAVRGAEKATRIAHQAGSDEATTHLISEAISIHLTPGTTYQEDGLGALISSAALVDLTGWRLWDVPLPYIDETLSRYPRQGIKRTLAEAWKRESRLVPNGRAAWIERVTLFSLIVRLAPLD